MMRSIGKKKNSVLSSSRLTGPEHFAHRLVERIQTLAPASTPQSSFDEYLQLAKPQQTEQFYRTLRDTPNWNKNALMIACGAIHGYAPHAFIGLPALMAAMAERGLYEQAQKLHPLVRDEIGDNHQAESWHSQKGLAQIFNAPQTTTTLKKLFSWVHQTRDYQDWLERSAQQNTQTQKEMSFILPVIFDWRERTRARFSSLTQPENIYQKTPTPEFLEALMHVGYSESLAANHSHIGAMGLLSDRFGGHIMFYAPSWKIAQSTLTQARHWSDIHLNEKDNQPSVESIHAQIACHLLNSTLDVAKPDDITTAFQAHLENERLRNRYWRDHVTFIKETLKSTHPYDYQSNFNPIKAPSKLGLALDLTFFHLLDRLFENLSPDVYFPNQKKSNLQETSTPVHSGIITRQIDQ